MPLKFLHTADWHLGKQLHKTSLGDDMDLFFDWLIDQIDRLEVDALLVAGDIFDLANPANEDRRRYYQLLAKLSNKCQVVITGGNHDSNRMLDAPSDLLDALKIHVVGGIDPDHLEREIVPLYDKDGAVAAVALAVPYLRDGDVRPYIDDLSQKSRSDVMRQGIIEHYQKVSQLAQIQYPDLPIIGMGHLWLAGSKTSDSERDITVGTLDAVDHSTIGQAMDYLALGHIHRPQAVDADRKIRYSGSPIPLSFSEREDHKRLLFGTVDKGKIKLQDVEVPAFRELRTIAGSLPEVKQALADYQPETPLPALVEVHVIEDAYDSTIPAQLAQITAAYRETTAFKIVKERTTYRNNATPLQELYEEGTHIEDLQPTEVFDTLLADTAIAADKADRLRDLFNSVYQDVVKGEE